MTTFSEFVFSQPGFTSDFNWWLAILAILGHANFMHILGKDSASMLSEVGLFIQRIRVTVGGLCRNSCTVGMFYNVLR